MKVLLLHQYFNTPAKGGALRSYYLAKALVDRGIKTVVITTHNQSKPERKIIEGIEVHYLPVGYDNRFGFFKRVVSFLKFVLSIVQQAGKFKDADVCYAISTPLTIGLAALWIKKRHRIPYYFEVGDLWPEAPIQMGIIRSPLLKAFLYRLEVSIYKRAKGIVALSEAIRLEIRRKVPATKIHVIPNMADTEFFSPESKRADLEEKFSVKNKFVISFIGTLGLANGLDYLVRAAQACAQHDLPVHIILCGDGAELVRLKDLAKQLKLTNLTFIPAQDREGVREVLNATDAIFVSYRPLPVLETGSPNKYFDGLAAGKLVVINFGGWMKDEIEKHQCGVSVDAQNPRDFVEKITPFLTTPDLLKSYQRASRNLAETTYSRKMLSDEFSKLFRGN